MSLYNHVANKGDLLDGPVPISVGATPDEQVAGHPAASRGWSASRVAMPTGADATMADVSDAAQVTDNHAESRFELQVGGHLAELSYRRNGNRLVLIHTEVPVMLEGRGIGGRLAAAAIDRAAREGMTVVPLCPFARGWLELHPDVASQAAIDWGDRPVT